jgi:hypothetical protein
MCVCDAFVFVAVTRLSCTVFSQRLHQNTCKLPLHLLLDCAPIPVGRLRRLSKTSYLSTQTDFTGQVTTTNPPSLLLPSPQDLCFPSLSHITAYTPVHFPFFLPLHQQNRQHPVAHLLQFRTPHFRHIRHHTPTSEVSFSPGRYTTTSPTRKRGMDQGSHHERLALVCCVKRQERSELESSGPGWAWLLVMSSICHLCTGCLPWRAHCYEGG